MNYYFGEGSSIIGIISKKKCCRLQEVNAEISSEILSFVSHIYNMVSFCAEFRGFGSCILLAVITVFKKDASLDLLGLNGAILRPVSHAVEAKYVKNTDSLSFRCQGIKCEQIRI
jgi:hypothetical protein